METNHSLKRKRDEQEEDQPTLFIPGLDKSLKDIVLSCLRDGFGADKNWGDIIAICVSYMVPELSKLTIGNMQDNVRLSLHARDDWLHIESEEEFIVTCDASSGKITVIPVYLHEKVQFWSRGGFMNVIDNKQYDIEKVGGAVYINGYMVESSTMPKGSKHAMVPFQPLCMMVSQSAARVEILDSAILNSKVRLEVSGRGMLDVWQSRAEKKIFEWVDADLSEAADVDLKLTAKKVKLRVGDKASVRRFTVLDDLDVTVSETGAVSGAIRVGCRVHRSGADDGTITLSTV